MRRPGARSTSPATGGCSPSSVRTKVDLPAPLGPMHRPQLAGRDRGRDRRQDAAPVVTDAQVADAQQRGAVGDVGGDSDVHRSVTRARLDVGAAVLRAGSAPSSARTISSMWST